MKFQLTWAVTFIGYFEAASVNMSDSVNFLGVTFVGAFAGLLALSPMTR